MKTTRILFHLLVLLLPAATLTAQHDPQRDATRHIAAGKYEKAREVLKKAEQDDPETRFVLTMLAAKQNRKAEMLEHAQAALDAGLPLERFVVGPREALQPLYESDQFKMWRADAKLQPLVHGPMLGAVTGSSASFWIRTSKSAQVQIRIGENMSDTVQTNGGSNFATVLKVENLKPGTRYDYEVWVDGLRMKTEKTTFRTFPEQGTSGKFSVGFGGGAGYVPKWEYMWDTIRDFGPDAMLMLGDNVYIDQPEFSLCQDYCYFRRQSRPEWKRLVASTAMYSIYDDHDFGTNDCVPGPDIENPAWKRKVWNRFRNNWVNPGYGGGEKQPGCWYDFYIGDVHFILLDGRYYRDLKSGSMLGPVQKKWLFETLRNSKGTMKVLASPVPWTSGIKPGSKDPWDGFPDEREEIFSFIEDNSIEGLFLIAADRHRTDLRVTERKNGYDLYEFESSKLTNRHTHGVVKTEGMIWGYNKTCSFGLMKFDTTKSPAQVTFECVTIDGKVLHQHVLTADKLKK